MVYVCLSVLSLEESVEFYSNKLGMFDALGSDRLICTVADIKFIIDLVQCFTKEHQRIFDQDSHLMSSLTIAPNDEFDGNITLIDRLKVNGVYYEETGNLGEHRLNFRDPSGNRFTFRANLGVIV